VAEGPSHARSFGERLTSLREARGLTSPQVGAALGVSRVCVWKWETGHMYPSPEKLERLADTLQISVSFLICGFEAQTGQPSSHAMLSFGQRLVRLRTACRLRRDELSSKINVTRMCIWKWENGQSYPRRAQLQRLAEALQTSVSMLEHGFHDHVAKPEIGSTWFRRQADEVKRVESLRSRAKA